MNNETGIYVGLALFLLVILPILIIRDVRQRRKIRRILESYKNGEVVSGEKGNSPSSPAGAKGWGMNSSPFRERKSGLSWGGGNIKGSEANRGSRRSFLKK